MLTPDLLRAKFDAGLAYPDYVDTGKPNEQQNWRSFEEQVSLTETQRALLSGLVRRVNILVSSGTWCGDCVQQVPMLARIEDAAGGRIAMRIVDRDEHADLADMVKFCGGHRVPAVLILNEDFDLLSLSGDRTLSRYRALAKKQLGASCPLPGAPVDADEVAATVQDWVDEVERAHLMARLSTKLRERHGD